MSVLEDTTRAHSAGKRIRTRIIVRKKIRKKKTPTSLSCILFNLVCENLSSLFQYIIKYVSKYDAGDPDHT